ncbi:hypothetical protein GOBAR_DD35408 [Gossypium barbadense]|nr:hypothetical protein GOBAR_DD35408 [Gossypium barbadense]
MKVGISSKTINHPSFVSVTQSDPSLGIVESYPIAVSPIHNFPSRDLEGPSWLTGECSSLFPLKKNELNSGPSSPSSPSSHAKGAFSHSSVFCTSLYLSSSSTSETQRQLGNFPFLPHPPTCHQLFSAVDSSKSPVVFTEDLCNPYDVDHSEVIMKDFLNFPGDARDDGCFHAVHKPRMRWTPELHECFVEAVSKLDGPEKKTWSSGEKKAALSIGESDGKKNGGMQITEALQMQIEVQKQLHEQLEYLYYTKKEIGKADYIVHDAGATPKGVLKLMNVELQRLLQLRIEEQARYLQKILEEQQKAGSALNPTLSLSAPTDPPSQNSELQQPSSPSAVHKANGVGVNECKTESRLKRFRFEDKPESAIDEAEVWKILCNNSFTQLNS